MEYSATVYERETIKNFKAIVAKRPEILKELSDPKLALVLGLEAMLERAKIGNDLMRVLLQISEAVKDGKTNQVA